MAYVHCIYIVLYSNDNGAAIIMHIGTLEYLIQTYGYWALLLGTFIEGETILLLAGVAAQLGYLDLSLVIMVAFIGSFSGDQFYFHLGRWKGQELLAKYPKWQAKANRVYCYLEKYHDLIMLGFRFVYGIRIMTPVVLAMNPKIKSSRFFFFNAIGALIWSVAVAGGGYIFGHAIEMVLVKIKNYEIAFLIFIGVAGTGILLFRRYWKKRHKPGECKLPQD